jgi:predicted glycosyltransferase
MRVTIVVTHLLGAGHLTRAAALARAFAKAGHGTTLISGGVPAPLVATDGVSFVQLPPVRVRGTDFKTLLDEHDGPVSAGYLAERSEALLRAFHAAEPDALLVELFPFGRRILGDEFTRLLEAAHARMPRPLVACSIRDVLVAPSKERRVDEARERFSRWFDFALVHGDPNLIPLEASWPVDDAMQPKLRYTGYVDEGPAPPSAAARTGIVVSGGSSAVGLALYRAALQAADPFPQKRWRILVGNGVPEPAFADLAAAARDNVTVERARPDFRALLAEAELSVSQCGYNTAVDVLRTGARAVFVPFEGGKETEQRLRAEALARRGIGVVLPEAELSADALCAAVDAALAQPAASATLDLAGAAKAVAIVEGSARPTPRRGASSAIDEALQAAADRGLQLEFWWRDDDAVAATLALDRLLALAMDYGIPLALAAIPAKLDPSLPERIAEEPGVSLLVHGLEHANCAPADVKKAEFTHGALDQLIEKAGRALELAAPLGSKLLPTFVPPWNRIAPELVPYLPRLGYRGLSTYGDRPAREPVPGLVQVNTHVDPIAWRGGGGALSVDAISARLVAAIMARVDGTADATEPIGLLTHHLVHDEAIWHTVESLLERLSRTGRLGYVSAGEAFSPPEPGRAKEP